MTAAEKQSRFNHLLLKFYDINTTPALILREEMQYGTTDDNILKMADKLDQLEIQQHKLTDEYSVKVARQILPLKRRFEYAQEQLLEKRNAPLSSPREFNPLNKFVRYSTEEQDKQKLADLRRDHHQKIQDIENDAARDLNACNQQLRTLFVDAVRYLYR